MILKLSLHRNIEIINIMIECHKIDDILYKYVFFHLSEAVLFQTYFSQFQTTCSNICDRMLLHNYDNPTTR